ncbi:hypothetical protein [Facklamia hominis]|uniref:hypothetical protein n=1 Tax=Facklamia hominis TaxID=178214 RepID=UPI0038FC6951
MYYNKQDIITLKEILSRLSYPNVKTRTNILIDILQNFRGEASKILLEGLLEMDSLSINQYRFLKAKVQILKVSILDEIFNKNIDFVCYAMTILYLIEGDSDFYKTMKKYLYQIREVTVQSWELVKELP